MRKNTVYWTGEVFDEGIDNIDNKKDDYCVFDDIQNDDVIKIDLINDNLFGED